MRVTAIVGSYRKGGTIDAAVDEILAAARDGGADVEKVYLIDRRIEFCTNCRACMQTAGEKRGACPIADEMETLLDLIDRSDGIVLASPVNFGAVTAVMKRFIERLACYAYWPWGMHSPQLRRTVNGKRAVLVSSSAAPAFLARLGTQVVGLLKKSARIVGARTVGVLFIGLAAQSPWQELGERERKAAHRLGALLAARQS